MSQSASTIIETLQLSFNGEPLPNNWRLTSLDEVCEFLDWRRVPVNNAERAKRIAGKDLAELYPYYGANGQTGWIDDYLFDESLILLAEDGGNFGSKDKPIAYAVTGRYWVNNHAHVLRPKENIIDFDFCLHALSIRPDVAEMVSGSTRAKLNQEVAAKLSIPLPPLDEQKRIAAILNEQMAAVARARAAAEAQLKAAKDLPAAYLREVFDSPEAEQWAREKLGNVSVISGGIQKTPERKPKNFHRPYLTVRNVQRGYLDLSELERFEITESELERLRLMPGDILIVEGNGSLDHIGRNALFKGEVTDCIHQNHIIRVRLDGQRFLPEFVSRFLNSNSGKSQMIQKAMTTSGLYTLSTGKVAALEIPMPSMTRQREIVEILDEKIPTAENACEVIKDQLETISTLPAALLRQAFTGKL